MTNRPLFPPLRTFLEAINVAAEENKDRGRFSVLNKLDA